MNYIGVDQRNIIGVVQTVVQTIYINTLGTSCNANGAELYLEGMKNPAVNSTWAAAGHTR